MTETAESSIPIKDQNSEFGGGSFNILYFAPEGGFKLKASRNLRRRDELDLPFPASGVNSANKEEVEYQKKENEKAAEKGEERNVHPLKSPNFRIRVGVLNLRREEDTLVFDTKPSTFVMANDDKNVGLALPENASIREGLGSQLAVAMILTTTESDGTSRMILQHRGSDNRTYKDMLGASAAGYVEQKVNSLNEQNTGTLKDVDTNFIQSMAAREMEEEVGIDPEYLTRVEVTGIAQDLKRVHYEALLLGRVSVSAVEVERLAAEKKSVKREAFDFSEDFFVIDASPEAISTLLTEVRSPIPPTHVAAFVAAGRLMILEREGQDAAINWTKNIQDGIKENNDEIDKIVEEATGGKEIGYNPRLSPRDQGLPDVVEALVQKELIDANKYKSE